MRNCQSGHTFCIEMTIDKYSLLSEYTIMFFGPYSAEYISHFTFLEYIYGEFEPNLGIIEGA